MMRLGRAASPVTGYPADEEPGPFGQDYRIDFAEQDRLIGFALCLAQLQTNEHFFAVFKADSIRPGELSVLAAIGNNPGIRQGALARALKIKWPSMAKIVRAFVDKGMVVRQVPEDDRRAVELRLSAKGQEFVARQLPKLAAVDQLLTGRLSSQEQDQLLRLLHKLLGPPSAAHAQGSAAPLG